MIFPAALNTNNIIYLNCNSNLLNERLKLRERGLPQRMRDLSHDEISKTIDKSINVIKNYISLSSNFKSRMIKIDTADDIDITKRKILSIISKN